MSEQIVSPADLTDRLRAWAEKKDIRPSEFARAMGYSYNHAYQLLRGNSEVTEQTLGRMAIVYGADVVKEVLAQSSSSIASPATRTSPEMESGETGALRHPTQPGEER